VHQVPQENSQAVPHTTAVFLRTSDHPLVDDWQQWCCLQFGGIAMKTIVSALIVLAVLAGAAAPVSALDAKQFYEQQDRGSR
jgi:hypothetical protein